MKYLKLFKENQSDATLHAMTQTQGEEDYEQFDIVYNHPKNNNITNEPLGIVEYDSDYPERPFRCLIWDNDEEDYMLHSGEIDLESAIDAINTYVNHGYDEDEDEN